MDAAEEPRGQRENQFAIEPIHVRRPRPDRVQSPRHMSGPPQRRTIERGRILRWLRIGTDEPTNQPEAEAAAENRRIAFAVRERIRVRHRVGWAW